MSDPTKRFSDRAADYARYRPEYPPAVLDVLRNETALSPAAAIADIGSGTGISAELFLRHGNTVYGVEPNAGMRQAAERILASYPQFVRVEGSAEATGLPDESVDFVVAAQACHWFEKERARREFDRILCPGGWVILMWNTRQKDTTPFLRAYEGLLQEYGTDYREVEHTAMSPAAFERFFAPHGYVRRVVPNQQELDLEGLRGRLRSSSYVPAPGHPNYEPMLEALEQVFRDHQSGGRVRIDYDTEIYIGRRNA